MRQADVVYQAEGLDPRLLQHRRIWQEKETLRLIYADYHQRLLAVCPPGPLLDIGGGSGHVKEFRPDAISADILPFPALDLVCDAHRLPFAAGHFAGVVMLDVLHHLARPLEFLKEAARALRPSGVLAMIEPGMSLLSYPFYRYLHHEGADLAVDPFAEPEVTEPRDPFESNQAIPTLLFAKDRHASRLVRALPELELHSIDWLSVFAYPLSGGFKSWCLVPAGQVQRLIRLENALPLPLRKALGFRLMVVFHRRG